MTFRPAPAVLPALAFFGASVLAALGIAAFVAGEKGVAGLGSGAWAVLLAGCAPAFGAELALGVPAFAARAYAWLIKELRARVAIGLAPAVGVALAGLAVGRFDPYVTAITACAGVGALAALAAANETGFGAVDGAVWLLLWIPFDLRGTYSLWLGPREFAYPWWAAAVTVFALLGWGGLRGWPGLTWRLLPTRADLAAAGIALLALLALVVPVGLAIGFLHFPPTRSPAAGEVAAQLVGLILTVALPEEVFFRGVLLNGLERATRRPVLAQVSAALAFGLMHWNNAHDLRTQVAYCALATVAGGVYGWAYRRSGGLTAPVLVHALTDAVWKFVLA